ncbi:hypothetical protein [Euzebya tangerina]|uniref:hypothetical protein n=1 Tax=Euzebya tangerina TaxID=591198 RepID=UPI0013C34D96|nr:hypothetical protein [Euzebya tangerina]
MFFITFGFAVLAGVVVGAVTGALVGGGLGALFGAGVNEFGQLGAPTPSPTESVAVALVFGIMIGGFVGFGLSLFYGAMAAGLATGLHTRLSAGTAGLIAAGVPSLIFGLWSLSGFGTDPIQAGVTVAVIGITIMFLPLFLVTFSTIRRSQRAAAGIPG